jgi:hypothetical protein
MSLVDQRSELDTVFEDGVFGNHVRRRGLKTRPDGG